MKPNEIREMSLEDLKAKIDELTRELADRFPTLLASGTSPIEEGELSDPDVAVHVLADPYGMAWTDVAGSVRAIGSASCQLSAPRAITSVRQSRPRPRSMPMARRCRRRRPRRLT